MWLAVSSTGPLAAQQSHAHSTRICAGEAVIEERHVGRDVRMIGRRSCLSPDFQWVPPPPFLSPFAYPTLRRSMYHDSPSLRVKKHRLIHSAFVCLVSCASCAPSLSLYAHARARTVPLFNKRAATVRQVASRRCQQLAQAIVYCIESFTDSDARIQYKSTPSSSFASAVACAMLQVMTKMIEQRESHRHLR